MPVAQTELLEPDAPADSGVCGTLCQHLLREVSEVVTHTIGDHGLAPPRCTLLLVGRHPAAVSYAQSTVAAARAAGVGLQLHHLPDTASAAGARPPHTPRALKTMRRLPRALSA